MAVFYRSLNCKTALKIISNCYKNSYLCGTKSTAFHVISSNNLTTRYNSHFFKRTKCYYNNNMGTIETSSTNELEEKMGKLQFVKPPNILIYCNKEKFVYMRNVVNSIVNSDCYVVYNLTDQQLSSTKWSDHAELLLVAKTAAPKTTTEQFQHFHQNGGKVLCFNSSLMSSLTGRNFKCCEPIHLTVKYKGKNIGEMSYDYSGSGGPDIKNISVLGHDEIGKQCVIFAIREKGTTICSLVDLIPMDDGADVDTPSISKERLEVLKDIFETELGLNCYQETKAVLTPCYLLGKPLDKSTFVQRLGGQLPCQPQQQLRLKSLSLVLCHEESLPPTPTPHLLPVMVGLDVFTSPYLNSEVYFSHLKTNTLGRVVLYGDVITTTMTPVQEMTECSEIIVIAGRQTQGKGRSGNSWLSPEGCAMFSFPVSFALNTLLGHRPSFVQHLIALAIVEGILQIPGYENLDIRLKWPNDIYIGRSKTKIGGLIVNSTIMKKHIHCVVGCGVNVSNSHPTTCVNDVIRAYNAENKTSLKILSTDQFIARTLNCFEKILETFQTKGHHAVTPIYLKRWMHSGAEVTLSDGGRGVVEGLDEFGFLTVKMAYGGVRSVQPDGNSFDMLHNLIATKEDRN